MRNRCFFVESRDRMIPCSISGGVRTTEMGYDVMCKGENIERQLKSVHFFRAEREYISSELVNVFKEQNSNSWVWFSTRKAMPQGGA